MRAEIFEHDTRMDDPVNMRFISAVDRIIEMKKNDCFDNVTLQMDLTKEQSEEQLTTRFNKLREEDQEIYDLIGLERFIRLYKLGKKAPSHLTWRDQFLYAGFELIGVKEFYQDFPNLYLDLFLEVPYANTFTYRVNKGLNRIRLNFSFDPSYVTVGQYYQCIAEVLKVLEKYQFPSILPSIDDNYRTEFNLYGI